MFWHKAMLAGTGTQREELLGSHRPPSPIENTEPKAVVVSGSPHMPPSCPAAAPTPESPVSHNPVSALPSVLALSFPPGLTLPSALARPSGPGLNLWGPGANGLPGPASKRRKSMEIEREDFLGIKWRLNTAVIVVEKWARSNPGSFLLSASRLVCDSAGEDGRIGVFIVGGDYICPGRDKGRWREQ